jgi:hypothetical protein
MERTPVGGLEPLPPHRLPPSQPWIDRLQPYMAQWVDAPDHVVTEERAHDDAAYMTYLMWYIPRIRTRVMYVPSAPPLPPIPDHQWLLPSGTYPVRRDQNADTRVSLGSSIIFLHITIHYNMCCSL